MIKKLLNPIEYFNDRKLLLSNLIIFTLGTTLAIFMKAVFGSPIDLHFENKLVPAETLTGNIIAILTMALVLLAAGKIINKKTRFIDCLNLAFYIRIPYYILTLFNITNTFSKMKPTYNDDNNIVVNLPTSSSDMLIMGSFSFLALFVWILIGVIIYFSFKTITNSKKATDYLILVGFLILSILLSYTISRYL